MSFFMMSSMCSRYIRPIFVSGTFFIYRLAFADS